MQVTFGEIVEFRCVRIITLVQYLNDPAQKGGFTQTWESSIEQK